MTDPMPLLVVMQTPEDKSIVTSIFKSDISHEGFGLVICDIVRHVAAAYRVEEDDIWEWVEKERHHHTTELRRAS
jgi:hypothetical protein